MSEQVFTFKNVRTGERIVISDCHSLEEARTVLATHLNDTERIDTFDEFIEDEEG